MLKNIRNKECFYKEEHDKSPSKSEPQKSADSEALESEFITRCRKSQYRDTGKDEMLEDKRCENDIVLDLGRYLQDLEKKTGSELLYNKLLLSTKYPKIAQKPFWLQQPLFETQWLQFSIVVSLHW